MDREFLVWCLARSERHVLQAIQHLDTQRQIIARLASGGHDTTVAFDVLKQFEASLAMHLADRERLRSELAQSNLAVR